MRSKIKKYFNLPRYAPIPNTTCDCCGKTFKPKSGQVQNIKKGLAKFLFCSHKCFNKFKMQKRNKKVQNGLCTVKGCNCKATKQVNHANQLPRLLCQNHWDLWYQKTKEPATNEDLLARYMMEPFLPTNILNETKLAREEWFKILLNDLCHKNYIRKNNEQYCGIVDKTPAAQMKTNRKQVHFLQEEDIYFIDLNLLVSLKRSQMTTNRKWTDTQLNDSKALFEKNWGFKVKSVSASIINESNVADMDIIEFLKYLLNEILKLNKKSKIKLPLGITVLKKSFNDVINTLQARKLQWYNLQK